jgi:hypothetical protein
VEVTYQGRRFRSHQDPQCRVPFTAIPAFRSASFAPRETVDLRTLTNAVEHFEALTGGEVDVEEAAIAAAAKRFADDELKLLLPLEATVQANALPVLNEVREYKANLETIQAADSDDCIRILAGEGKSLKASRDQVRDMRHALVTGGSGLATVLKARTALHQVWPALQPRVNGADGTALTEASAGLASGLASPTFYEQVADLNRHADALGAAYRDLYQRTHAERTERYASAIDDVRGQSEWTVVTPDAQETLIAPLVSRACETVRFTDDGLSCTICRATVGQMESDLAALPGLRAQALARLQELSAPDQKVERVRLADYFAATLTSHEAVDAALERLREDLYKLVDEQSRIVLE